MQTAYKSIRLFKSPYLEWFSHIHPMTPLVVWMPVVAFFLWRSAYVLNIGLGQIVALGALALLTWTLAEYCLHRFVFHFKPKGEWQERLAFIMHGIHHADPVDPTRLVMPPVVATILAVIHYWVFRALLGPVLVEPFFAFFIVGYLCYDYTHYAVHHFTPRTRFGKFIKQSHMIHHYVNHDIRWGVSTPLWDYVFGTMKDPAAEARKRAKASADAGQARASRLASASNGKV